MLTWGPLFVGLIEITDDVLPEINVVLDENAPKELFPVINDLVMTILRAMLIMTIPCAAAAADVVRPAPTSNWLLTAANWCLMLSCIALGTYLMGGWIGWARCRQYILNVRHVRSDRLERELRVAQEQLADAQARIAEYLVERDRFQESAGRAHRID